MKTPAFWRRGQGGVLASLLAPLGWIYGRLTLARMDKPGWRAPIPVIAIGNATAGGAGKTPMAIALAKALQARGAMPYLITRGYGGFATGPVLVAGQSAQDVGDEALLLAQAAPTVVARDRVAGARLAAKLGATCLILDDALQNPALVKDITLCVVDGAGGLGNGRVLPAGPLRAPLNGQKPFIDAFVVVGEAHTGLAEALGADRPIHAAHLDPTPASAALKGQRVIAYCGLGLPEKFESSVRAAGAEILAAHRFADHHPYSDEEAMALLDAARASGAVLVTTAKDRVKLAGSPALDALAKASFVLEVAMALPPVLIAVVSAVALPRP